MGVDGLGVRYATRVPELNLPGIPVTIQVFSSVCGYSFVRNLCLLVLIRFGVGVWGLPETRSCQVAKLTSNLRSNPLASAP